MNVTDPAYWKDQLERAGEHLHLATWWAPLRWHKFHGRRHRQILARMVKPVDSVLDAGCAHGELLDLMPATWYGEYAGVDVSLAFLKLAKRRHPGATFYCGDLLDLSMFGSRSFDWAILRSVKHTLIGHAGQGVWAEAEGSLLRVAKQLLYLEFDIAEEPDYGVPKQCHKEWEATLLTDEDRDREDRR